MAKPVWRVNLITEFGPRTVSETELARIERDDLAFPKTDGRTLEEGNQLTAATQAAIVHTQAFRWASGSDGASLAAWNC